MASDKPDEHRDVPPLPRLVVASGNLFQVRGKAVMKATDHAVLAAIRKRADRDRLGYNGRAMVSRDPKVEIVEDRQWLLEFIDQEMREKIAMKDAILRASDSFRNVGLSVDADELEESLSVGNHGEPKACTPAEERGIVGATGAGQLPDGNPESTGDSAERRSPVGTERTPSPDESNRHHVSKSIVWMAKDRTYRETCYFGHYATAVAWANGGTVIPVEVFEPEPQALYIVNGERPHEPKPSEVTGASEAKRLIDALILHCENVATGHEPASKNLDAARDAVFSALLRTPPEATGTRWIPVGERLPESGVPVLAHITNSHGKTRRLRAQWIAKHTYELWDGDDMAGDYSEETDTTYTPEGWYETNEYEETHFHINDPVSHWTPLPPGPDQASIPHEPEGVLALVKQKRDEYRSFLDAGKGTWPGSDYIQDETWARWQGAWSVLDSIVSQAERERPCLFDKLVGNPLDGFPSTKSGEQT